MDVQWRGISSPMCRHREASCGSWKNSHELVRSIYSEQCLREGGIQTLYTIWHRNSEVLELFQPPEIFHLVYIMGSGSTLFPTSSFVLLGFPGEVLMRQNSMGRAWSNKFFSVSCFYTMFVTILSYSIFHYFYFPSSSLPLCFSLYLLWFSFNALKTTLVLLRDWSPLSRENRISV